MYLCLMRARVAEELAFLPGSSLYECLVDGGGGSCEKGAQTLSCFMCCAAEAFWPAHSGTNLMGCQAAVSCSTCHGLLETDAYATCLFAGDMSLVSAFIRENANMARERCSAVCAALVQNVPALAVLPHFAQQVPIRLSCSHDVRNGVLAAALAGSGAGVLRPREIVTRSHVRSDVLSSLALNVSKTCPVSPCFRLTIRAPKCVAGTGAAGCGAGAALRSAVRAAPADRCGRLHLRSHAGAATRPPAKSAAHMSHEVGPAVATQLTAQSGASPLSAQLLRAHKDRAFTPRTAASPQVLNTSVPFKRVTEAALAAFPLLLPATFQEAVMQSSSDHGGAVPGAIPSRTRLP